MEKITGTTKWFNATRGIGFITREDTGLDIFVHQSAILMDGFRKLDETDVVTFVVGTDAKGRECAQEVYIIEKAGESSNE